MQVNWTAVREFLIARRRSTNPPWRLLCLSVSQGPAWDKVIEAIDSFDDELRRYALDRVVWHDTDWRDWSLAGAILHYTERFGPHRFAEMLQRLVPEPTDRAARTLTECLWTATSSSTLVPLMQKIRDFGLTDQVRAYLRYKLLSEGMPGLNGGTALRAAIYENRAELVERLLDVEYPTVLEGYPDNDALNWVILVPTQVNIKMLSSFFLSLFFVCSFGLPRSGVELLILMFIVVMNRIAASSRA
jgi:hypothetical protein